MRRAAPAALTFLLVAGLTDCGGEPDEDRVRVLTFATGEERTAHLQESIGLGQVFSGGDDWLVESASRPADSAVRAAVGWTKEAWARAIRMLRPAGPPPHAGTGAARG